MIQQFILFFALIITGYLCKKFGIVTEGMDRGLNRFIITISFPCLILYRMVHLDISDRAFTWFLLTVGINLCLFAVFAAYAFGYVNLRKYKGELKPIAEFSIISPNNGFMGFPVAVTFFGSLGLLFMVATNLSLNLMLFTYGIVLMKRGRSNDKKTPLQVIWGFVKQLINPKIAAAVIGLILCYNNVLLPDIIDEYVNILGSVASPMALVFIGSTLYGCSFLNTIKKIHVLEITLNKLFIMPIITLIILYFVPIPNLIKAVIVVSNALPVAATVPIFSELYDRDKDTAGEALFISTVASIGTIPLWLMIVSYLFL